MADNLRESGFQILHCSEDDLVPEENADQLHEVTIPCSDFLFKSSVIGIPGNNDTEEEIQFLVHPSFIRNGSRWMIQRNDT